MNDRRRLALLIAIFFLLISSTSYSIGKAGEDNYLRIRSRARVLEVEIEKGEKEYIEVQSVKIKILGEKLKGNVLTFKHQLNSESKQNIELQKSMNIFVEIDLEKKQGVYIIHKVAFVDVIRDYYLRVLFFLFFTLLIIFGGFKGLRSFIALLITGVCIFYLFIPMVLKGYHFVLSTIVVSAIITVTSFILISGFTAKSCSAILGTIGGTVVSGVLAILFGNLIYLTGIGDETIDTLVKYTSLNIDYRGLLYSGITIGVLGAVMDVSMTITSVIYEIKKNNQDVRIRALFLSGLSVGRDIMATMTNTLILAYAGTSLPLILLFIFSDMSFVDILNSQYVASEIIRSLSGSIGLVLTIPITSLIAAVNS